MEIVHILRELGTLRAWLVALALLAAGVAVVAGYRVSPGLPPSLEERTLDVGAASSQLLVDAPQSSLTNLEQDPAVLATRALVYAQAMSSPQARALIAEATGYPPNDIVAKGPFSSESERVSYQARPAEERANELLSEGAPYRLLFDAQQELPLISVYTQAPSASEALELAKGATVAVQQYVTTLQSEDVPEKHRIIVRELGTAEGGAIASGGGPMIMVLAFLGTFAVGCVLIVLISRLRREWRRVDAESYTESAFSAESVTPMKWPPARTAEWDADPEDQKPRVRATR